MGRIKKILDKREKKSIIQSVALRDAKAFIEMEKRVIIDISTRRQKRKWQTESRKKIKKAWQSWKDMIEYKAWSSGMKFMQIFDNETEKRR